MRLLLGSYTRRQFVEQLAVLGATSICSVVPQAVAQGLAGRSPVQKPSDAASNVDGLPAFEPVAKVGPFLEDRRTVFLFLRFSCPFSAAFHSNFLAWGGSLPQPLRFARIPVLSEPVDGPAAMAHSMVRIGSPSDLADFEQRAFAAVHAEPTRYADPALYADIIKALRIKKLASSKSPEVRERMARSMRLFVRYGVEATPTLAIGGASTVTPVSTGGDIAMLMQLANGLVSRTIESTR